MRGGGVVRDRQWFSKASLLRDGDWIQVNNWSPAGEFFYGGEILVVAAKYDEGDGYTCVLTYAYDCPSHDRRLSIKHDSLVTLVQRDIVAVEKPVKISVPRAVRGRQLKLRL